MVDDNQLPKQIFYSKFKRKMKKRQFEKEISGRSKTNMKECNIDIKNWETNAMDRNFWRSTARKRAIIFKAKRSTNFN